MQGQSGRGPNIHTRERRRATVPKVASQVSKDNINSVEMYASQGYVEVHVPWQTCRRSAIGVVSSAIWTLVIILVVATNSESATN
eukprot:scaffold142300_cov30-Tisochrysis_lutea.AAC.3